MACLSAVFPAGWSSRVGPFLALWKQVQLRPFLSLLILDLDSPLVCCVWLLWAHLGLGDITPGHMPLAGFPPESLWPERLTRPLLLPVPWKLELYWMETGSA